MIKKAFLAVATLASLSSLPAQADVSFNVGAVTDYRYRGISQSRLDPALQGGADWVQSADGGFYVGTWASTIKWIKDAGAEKGSVEVDVYGGYKGSIMEGLGYDVGLLQYWYPRNKLGNVTGLKNANTTELYGAMTYGPVTAKYSHALTNTFGNPDSKNSFYFDLSGSFEITDGYMLVPHVGYQKIKGPNDDLGSYTDYSLGVSKDFSGFVVSATFVGTNADKAFYVTPASDGSKFTGKNALVVGVKYTF
ncbi:TorF family putative porin [Azohydromonas australica]|uniref:TorF family putative porin n=1 Tax=Azohydromonas australica TaxID=364039 RepID=UPI0003F89DE2|nr:TorF family putative porin [Azohydromonas australica]